MRPVRLRVILATALLIVSATTFPALAAEGGFDVETVSLDTLRMNGYLAAEAVKVSREAWERIDSREKLEKERDRLYHEFLFMIGLDPLPARTPLEVRQVCTVQRKGYTIEVLYFQSLPGFYVTANLYRPEGGPGPFPAVVWGPGHSSHVDGAKALCQKYAIPWVRNGYICLMVDPIQVAEVFGVHRGTHARGMWDWFARGYSPIGIEVWNAMRAVDYLLTRRDVDSTRLTINGVSGGGHLSWMAGAADRRFSVVQPVAGTGDIQTHVGRDLERSHCDCAYFINVFRHDWTILAALVSPRPLLLGASTEDSYYPTAGYRNVYEKASQLYSRLGVADRVSLFEVPGGHDYTQAEREKAVEWSDLWLKGLTSHVEEKPFEEVPGEQLAALGGMYGQHPPNINARIQELLIPTARLVEFDDPAQWLRKKAEILDRLELVTFRNLPADRKGVKVAEGEHGAVILETEPGIRVGVISNVPESMGPRQKAVLYVASEGDTEDMGIWNFMKAYPFPGYSASRHMVFPRGLGRGIWDQGLVRKYERNAMLIGRSLDDMRLYDVLCAVDYVVGLPSFAGTELTVVGKGNQSVLAVYAALLDRRITRVMVFDPPESHRQGPVFLDVLRYTDIPQAMALLAPRELVFLTGNIDRFDYTRKIYGLLGAQQKFRRAYTVEQALSRPD